MELYIKDVSDITYKCELIPAVLIRFCECKTNQRGLIRRRFAITYGALTSSISYLLIKVKT